MSLEPNHSRRDATERLSKIHSHLRALVHTRLGKHLAQASDDICQDSFLVALLRDQGQGVPTHQRLSVARLVRIAELRILGQMRIRGREVSGAEFSLPVGEPACIRPRRRYLRQTTRRGLYRLRPDHHWSLLLRDLLGTRWDTIAVVLGQESLNAVRCLHQKARHSLGRDPHLVRPSGDIQG